MPHGGPDFEHEDKPLIILDLIDDSIVSALPL